MPQEAIETPPLVISVDAMGGDLGPRAVIDGLERSARKKPELHFLLHGPEDQLHKLLHKRRNLADRVSIRHAPDMVAMTDRPSSIVRHGRNTSMWSAIEAVREGSAPIAISCGNTGALMGLSMLRLRRLPDVSRPAIAILWPSDNPQNYNVVLDVGADIRADPRDLLQFALMGISYARNGLGVARPRVGLLNVGVEEGKGRHELHEAQRLIKLASNEGEFDYIGYVEGGDIGSKRVDVVVTDGFSGNVALKTAEGTARIIGDRLKNTFSHSPLSRLSALLAAGPLRRLRKGIDPRRANGGVFLGLNGLVVKSHGAADALSVSSAVKLAVKLVESGFSEKLAAKLALTDLLDASAPEAENTSVRQ